MIERSNVYLVVVLIACFGPGCGVQAQDLLDQGRSFQRAGQWAQALAAYQGVVSQASDPHDKAVAYNNTCLVHIRLSDHQAADAACRRALDLRREIGDQRGLARTLNNLGLVLRYQGGYDEAAIAYGEALAINERLGDAQAQVQNRSNLGVLFATAGRYGEAIRHHAAAEAQAEQHLQEPWARRQVEIARLNQGVVLEKLGAYREALEIFLALAAVGDGGDLRHWASIQVNLGVIYRNLGNPVRAVAAFEEAAEIYQRLGDSAALSNVQLNLALALHLNLHRLAEAEVAYLRALDLARQSGDRSEEVQDHYYLGILQLETGRVAAAEASFQRCLDVAGPAEARWPGLYGLGRVAEARGRPRAALAVFRQAMDEIEQVRRGLAESNWRSGYFGDKRPIYAAAVRVSAALQHEDPEGDHAEQALAVVERAKARELVELLGASGKSEAPLDAAAIRAVVGAGELWLEYFQGERDLFLWVIERTGVQLVGLGPSAPILDRVAQVYRLLATGREPSAAAVGELSRALLGPVRGLGDAAGLRIAADGRLHYLPFEILPDPTSPDRLLVDRWALTYAPSLSALARLDHATPASPKIGRRLVAFGDPELPLEAAHPRSPASLLVSRYDLQSLPDARREIHAVQRVVRGEGELRFGAAATEEAFRRVMTRGARVVHLATHTVLDEGAGQGIVVLAAGDGHDGLLRPEEISALDYRAELTVLASCRSALGAIEQGRALSSLTGSFLAAGSSAVVATLWDVDDAASAAFMEQFYHQLSRGADAAEALRRAKNRLRATPGWNRSELWAAWVLVGRGGVNLAGPPIPVWIWGLTAVFLAAVLWFAAAWAFRRTGRVRKLV